MPQKRGRPSTSWDLDAEGSAKRTHHTPATRTEQDKAQFYDSTKQSKDAHPISAQRLCRYPLPGTSAPQETVVSPEQEQSEGRKRLEMQHDSCSMQQIELQSGGSAEGREEHGIPRTLTKRQRSMLRTDVERGIIRCKLCPAVELSSWQCFRRHCNTSKDHPTKLTFCDRCGDYFGRQDSEKRHKQKKNQEECRTMSRDQAKGKKKTVERLFEDFNAKMDHCLRTGEELGPRFAAMITQANVPTTSNKVRLGGES